MVLSQADKILEEVDWLINKMKNYLGSEAAGNIYEGPLWNVWIIACFISEVTAFVESPTMTIKEI